MIGDPIVEQPATKGAPPPPETPPEAGGAGEAVTVVGPDGGLFQCPPDKLAEALRSGYRLRDAKDEARDKVFAEEEQKGALGSFYSGLESAANQATFGLANAIREGTQTPEERQAQELRDEYHSTARVLGGAVGLGGSLLAGGELFKGLELAGQAVSHGILPAEQVAHAGLAARLAAKGAEYATQGALLSTPAAVAQAAFGDPRKAAETLLWGIGAGAALGGAGELLGSGVSGVKGAIGGALGEENAQKALTDFATNRTVKAIGGERTQVNKLSPERLKEVAEFAHEEGLIQPGMSRADVGAAIDAAHTKYGERMGEVLGSLDGLVEKGTAAENLERQALRPGEIGDKLMAEFNTPEMHMPMNADQRAALDMVVESANRLPTKMVNGVEVVPFETAQNFVSSLRSKWVTGIKKAMNEGGIKGPESVTPLDAMKSAAYQVARDTVHQAGDRVALAAGDTGLVGELARAKQAYSKVAELDRWAATREAQQAGNKWIGLTDWISAGSGAITGAHIGGAIGSIAGPLGTAAGALVGKIGGGILSVLAKHWGEDKGLVYLSALAHKAAKDGPEVFSAVLAHEGNERLAATLEGVKDTVKRLATSGVQKVAANSQEHMKALLGSTSGLTADQSYSKLSGRLATLNSNPEALAELTSAMSAPFASTAPSVAAAYQQKVTDAVHYLWASMPKAPTPPAPFAPMTWAPTAQEKQDWHDKAEIVANPMSAMQHVAQGTLSPAHLEALQTIYPVVYQMMKEQILDFHASHPDVKLPLAERQSVATFLGTPLDTFSDGDSLRVLQASYQPKQQAPGPTGGKPQKPKKTDVSHMPSFYTQYSSTIASEPPGDA